MLKWRGVQQPHPWANAPMGSHRCQLSRPKLPPKSSKATLQDLRSLFQIVVDSTIATFTMFTLFLCIEAMFWMIWMALTTLHSLSHSLETEITGDVSWCIHGPSLTSKALQELCSILGQAELCPAALPRGATLGHVKLRTEVIES